MYWLRSKTVTESGSVCSNLVVSKLLYQSIILQTIFKETLIVAISITIVQFGERHYCLDRVWNNEADLSVKFWLWVYRDDVDKFITQ